VDLLSDAGREIIATDLLGHGTAPKPHVPAEYVNLEANLTAALPPESPVDAVGFSLGSRLLLSVAATRPDTFGRIVVGGVGENVFRNDDAEPMARLVEGSLDGAGLGTARAGGRASLARALARFAQTPGNDPLALAACLRRPVDPLTPEMLGEVRVPVLVVLGDRDFAGPAGPLVDALPDATLVVLEGVDHLATPMSFGFIDAALGFLGAIPA
jgi:pimeloyl-ACP methyl ester carboxylesterase